MKLRIRVILGLVATLAITPAFWPDLGSVRAQSDRTSSEATAPATTSKAIDERVMACELEMLGWSVPEPVLALNTDLHELPCCISPDGLSFYFMYFRRVDPMDSDLYVVHRPDLEAEWGEPVKLPDGINTDADERTAFVSADGTSLYFMSDRAEGMGGHDLYVSRRTNVDDDGAWQPPENLSPVNSPGFDGGPTLFEDESGVTHLYFACAPEPGGTQYVADIYVSRLGPYGFEPPSRVAELSSPGSDRRPHVRHDGLEIYYTSDRTGVTTIYHSRRSSTAAPWSPPVAVFEPADLGYPRPVEIEAPVLSWDATTLFLGVYRNYRTNHDIYVAHRKEMQLIHDP